jgi:hypothetical protein
MTDPVHGPEAARWGGWSWRRSRRGEHFRRCSYCGSISPDDLAGEPEWRAYWADRKYGWPHKFYVDVPTRNPDTVYVVGSTTEPDYYSSRDDWIAVGDLTPEQRAIAQNDGFLSSGETFLLFDVRTHHHAKFYTVHLADRAITAAARDTIEQRCGLGFRFNDGYVTWYGLARTDQ